jgi:Flp pilus assembly protein TadB
MGNKASDRPVPGAPDTTEYTVDGQRALGLHARIAVIATVLCAFVAVVFDRLGSIGLAVVFAGVAVLCLLVLGWALHRKRRGSRVSLRREPGK